MYESEITLIQHWKNQGYENLGEVMWQRKAYEAYQKSTNKEEHLIGRCYSFVIMHDLKAFCTIDSSD